MHDGKGTMAPSRNLVRSLIPAVLLAIALGGCATGLRQASSPEAVGLSSERLKDISATFQAGVDKKELPGAVVLIAREGKIAYFEAFGFRDREAAAPMTRDAIFRIASMTKPVTSAAIMMLVEKGRLTLSDPVSRYLPEFNDMKVGVERATAAGSAELTLESARQEMTIHDLLRHTSGLTYGFIGQSLVKDQYNAADLFDPDQSLAEVMTKLSRLPLQDQPGTTWDYGMSTDVAGRIVEVASGMELSTFFEERIFAPLGMSDTAFELRDPEKLARVAQPQVAAASGRRPDVPDPSQTSWHSGGAGLFSTAADYARFCQMLLNGGHFNGVRLLSRTTVVQMLSDQIPAGTRIDHIAIPVLDVRPEAGQSFGLGFAVRVADGRSAFPGTIGDASWVGIYGTQFWIDPERSLLAIMLVQLAPPSPTYPVPVVYWQLMRDLVYNALAKRN